MLFARKSCAYLCTPCPRSSGVPEELTCIIRREVVAVKREREIADRCVTNSDHISRGAVDILLMTRFEGESSLDICRSAGFQTGAVILIIGRVSISQSVGKRKSKKRGGVRKQAEV
jgi:hypothetical protein